MTASSDMSHTPLADDLIALMYELLDAHDDTARLADDLSSDLHWAAHLDYLRNLQRVTRGVLARATAERAQASMRSV